MTTLVYVSNDETSNGRSLEVIQVAVDRNTGFRNNDITEVLPPGMKRSYHIHSLRELIVREVEPR